MKAYHFWVDSNNNNWFDSLDQSWITIPFVEKYKVDFSSNLVDLQTRAAGRMLKQFHKSPVLLSVLYALVSEIQALSDEIIRVLKFRSIYWAQGEVLNAVGRIVGKPRFNYAQSSRGVITENTLIPFVTEDRNYYIQGNKVVTVGVSPDEEYQLALLLHIFCNMNEYSSVPIINDAVYKLSGMSVRMNVIAPMTIQIEFPPDADIDLANEMQGYTITQRADNVYIFPFPATLAIASPKTVSDIWTEIEEDVLNEDYEIMKLESTYSTII